MNPNNISSFFKEIKGLDSNEVAKTGILKILFYIYYLEEYLLTNDLNKIFKDYQNQNYSLINPKWIQKYKELYNYKSISDYLKDSNNHITVNYNNLDGNIKIILDSYLAKNSNSTIIELPEKLLNIDEMKPLLIEYEELSFYGKNYLISEKIIEMIKQYVFKNKFLSIPLNKINVINNNIFLFDNNKLIIGNLFDELLFKPKYILNYGNSNTLQSERNLFISNSVEKYLELRGCKNNIIYEKQILKNENYKNIGELIVLNNESLLNKKNKIIFKNLQKKDDIIHEVIKIDSKYKMTSNYTISSNFSNNRYNFQTKNNYISFSNNIQENGIQNKEIENNEKESFENENKSKDNEIKKLKNKKLSDEEKIEFKKDKNNDKIKKYEEKNYLIEIKEKEI